MLFDEDGNKNLVNTRELKRKALLWAEIAQRCLSLDCVLQVIDCCLQHAINRLAKSAAASSNKISSDKSLNNKTYTCDFRFVAHDYVRRSKCAIRAACLCFCCWC